MHSVAQPLLNLVFIRVFIRFAHLLQGFLNYRKKLHELGLVQGVQWLDGSFVENIEVLESRAPNDCVGLGFSGSVGLPLG